LAKKVDKHGPKELLEVVWSTSAVLQQRCDFTERIICYKNCSHHFTLESVTATEVCLHEVLGLTFCRQSWQLSSKTFWGHWHWFLCNCNNNDS